MKKKFKKAIAVLLALLMVTTTISVFPLTVSSAEKTEESVGATSGRTGKCTWMLDDEGTLTISGEGAMQDYFSISDSPWAYSDIKSVVINPGVTTIGKSSFFGCEMLTSISISESVKSIGDLAFYGCKELTNLTIPDGVTSIGGNAFHYCESLESINIPDSVESVGVNAFGSTAWFNKQPNGLVYVGKIAYKFKGEMPENTSLEIKNGTIGIADYAFWRCNGLTSITIPASVRNIGEEAFYECKKLTNVTIPDGVMKIGSAAFRFCEKLTSVTIPKSVTKIGEIVFEGCVSINSIDVDEENAYYDSRNGCNAIIETKTNTLIKGCKNTVIDNSITKIDDYAFNRCSSLKSITIPDSVTYIGSYAFSKCDSLTSLNIPDSVTYIGNYAFEHCESLTSLNISNNLTDIGSYAFSGLYCLQSITVPGSVTHIGECAFAWCKGLTSITISDGVTSIGRCMFFDCPGLTSITIPDSVTSIGDCAFGSCPGLTSITIPDSVTSIGDTAFAWCEGLTSITIPASVTNIGDYAFIGCAGFTSITIPDSVTSIGDYAFGYYSIYDERDVPSYFKYDNFTISGYTGTAAEAYAYENGFEFIALDDPETQPTDPQTEPTEPETQPTDPQTEPTQPEIQPTDPQTEPTQPEIQPTDPQTEPTQPETQPTDPQTEPTEPIDENAPAFEITGATAKAEETVTLDLSIKNNPGITSFRVYIDYPEDALTLTDVEFKDLFSGRASGKNSLTSPYNVLWFSADSADENCNGIIATLTFTVKENTAAGDYPITLTCSADDIFNSQFEDVSFAAVSSTVKVIEYIPGDANGDNEINMKDVVLLRQYLNEWDVEIDERALDVNRDGKINMKDIVLLQQYINDWDVVLF